MAGINALPVRNGSQFHSFKQAISFQEGTMPFFLICAGYGRSAYATMYSFMATKLITPFGCRNNMDPMW